jgi:uncharacterized membrane protein
MRGLIVLLIFLLSICTVSAYSIEEYDYDFYIAFNKVVVENKISFKESVTGVLKLNLPSDADAITVYLDGKDVNNHTVESGVLTLDLDSVETIELNYITKELLEGSSFLLNTVAPGDIENLRISLYLPENAVLASPIRRDTLSSNAVFPRPTNLKTDGQSIMIEWLRENVVEGEEFSAYVIYKTKTGFTALTVVLIAVILVLAGYAYFKKTKVITQVKTRVKVKDLVEKHLKEDEEQVVNILKQREGVCEQGTLRIITDFSKAKLSGLLKELEERKVVKREKRGKKNLVFLKE